MSPQALAMVFLGGGLGSVFRFALVSLIKPASPQFPLGTLAVNLLGCALIGALAGVLHESPLGRNSTLWLLLAIGVLGGFTTFSSLAIETADLLREGRYGAAAAYLALSNTLGPLLALGCWWVVNTLGGGRTA